MLGRPGRKEDERYQPWLLFSADNNTLRLLGGYLMLVGAEDKRIIKFLPAKSTSPSVPIGTKAATEFKVKYAAEVEAQSDRDELLRRIQRVEWCHRFKQAVLDRFPE